MSSVLLVVTTVATLIVIFFVEFLDLSFQSPDSTIQLEDGAVSTLVSCIQLQLCQFRKVIVRAFGRFSFVRRVGFARVFSGFVLGRLRLLTSFSLLSQLLGSHLRLFSCLCLLCSFFFSRSLLRSLLFGRCLLRRCTFSSRRNFGRPCTATQRCYNARPYAIVVSSTSSIVECFVRIV